MATPEGSKLKGALNRSLPAQIGRAEKAKSDHDVSHSLLSYTHTHTPGTHTHIYTPSTHTYTHTHSHTHTVE